MLDQFPQQLQKAIETTLQRYQRFLAFDPGDDPKRVTAHHQAGKSAVTHMTALLKLMQLFDKAHPHKQTNKQNDADLESLLLQARNVLSSGGAPDAENQL